MKLEYEGDLHPIDRTVYFIGRGIERVHLYIHSDLLSRVHARVFWESGAFMFEDCRSENGTLYEGRMNREPQAIRDGDVFLLAGRVPLTFRLGDDP